LYIEYGSHSLLTRGGQGAVHFGLLNSTPCAVKVFRSGASREVGALLHLSNTNPHLYSWKMVNFEEGVGIVCSELALCDMYHALHARGYRGFNECHTYRGWMHQVAAGLAYMHKMGVAHRDIKPSNILLSPASRSLSTRVELAARATQHKSYGPVESGAVLRARRAAGLNGVEYYKHIKEAHAVMRDEFLCTLKGPCSATADEGETLSSSCVCAPEAYAAARLSGQLHTAKLCDFGFCTPVASGKSGCPAGYSYAGTPPYCSPEVCRRSLLKNNMPKFVALWGRRRAASYSAGAYDACSADAWSYGVTLFVVSTGSKPFHRACLTDPKFRAFLRWQAREQPHILEMEASAPGAACWKEHSSLSWEWPEGMSFEIKHLIRACWRLDPVRRITAAQIHEHVWFKPVMGGAPSTDEV
jgi:serine/threonine protein kinase